MRACEKRPVSVAELETLATSIELTLRNQLKPEVTSKDIGELVMEKLRDLDEVAYVRFALVQTPETSQDSSRNSRACLRNDDR